MIRDLAHARPLKIDARLPRSIEKSDNRETLKQPLREGIPLVQAHVQSLVQSESASVKRFRRRTVFFFHSKLIWVFVTLILATGMAVSANAQNGFTEEVVFSGLLEPTSIEFASDGRVFVAERGGLIKVFDNLSDTTETVFADLRLSVYTGGNNGLLSIALDPAFPTKPFVYVLYTYNGG